MSEDVYILGAGMIKFGKFLERSVKDMTGLVLEEVLEDCGLARDDIQAAWFSNTMWGLYDFQHSIRGQVALTANGLQGIPVTNVENACASASTALHGAWTAVKAGLYDCALAIGVEKQYNEDRAKVMQSFIAGTDVQEMAARVSELRKAEQKKRKPDRRGAPKARRRRPAVTPRSWTSTRREPAPTWRRTGPRRGSSPSSLPRITTTRRRIPWRSTRFRRPWRRC
jgi:hypothetical protein